MESPDERLVEGLSIELSRRSVDPVHTHPRDRLVPGVELSMGMSHDYQVEIEVGASIVRIGTAMFCARRD